MTDKLIEWKHEGKPIYMTLKKKYWYVYYDGDEIFSSSEYDVSYMYMNMFLNTMYKIKNKK